MRIGMFVYIVLWLSSAVAFTNYSLRFFGTGTGDIDRVKLPVDGPGNLINVAGDFTIEFWVKAFSNENTASVSPGANENWMYGNIIIDRDTFGPGDYGDYGISLGNGRVAFGVASGMVRRTILGATFVADGNWHHVAITRALGGAMRIFVNGTQDAFHASGPSGNISYRTGRPTTWTNDPFLTIGSEKFDYDPLVYPSFRGWLDEVRISTNVRYTTNFQRPTVYLVPDDFTVALFDFNEGSGTVISNSALVANPVHGTRMVAWSPERPQYSTDVPPVVPEPVVALILPSVLLAMRRWLHVCKGTS